MMNIFVCFNSTNGFDSNRTVFRHASQVVSQQIDNHDVFRAILGASSEIVDLPLVLLGRLAARPGALDWPGFDLAPVDPQKALRRRAGQDKIPEIEVAGERGGIAFAQAAIELQRW